MKPDRTINKYKARLVAKCYKQKQGIGCFDTHSLVTRITIIHVLVAFTSIYDLTDAFLHGNFEEEIYID